MKKLIFLLMMLMSVTVFAEKLTTDGKYNLDKLEGEWESAFSIIYQENGIWYYQSDEFPTMKIKKYKNGILKIHVKTTLEKDDVDNNFIFYIAWDTKYKTLVKVDKNGNILRREKRIVECLNGICS